MDKVSNVEWFGEYEFDTLPEFSLVRIESLSLSSIYRSTRVLTQ